MQLRLEELLRHKSDMEIGSIGWIVLGWSWKDSFTGACRNQVQRAIILSRLHSNRDFMQGMRMLHVFNNVIFT